LPWLILSGTVVRTRLQNVATVNTTFAGRAVLDLQKLGIAIPLRTVAGLHLW